MALVKHTILESALLGLVSTQPCQQQPHMHATAYARNRICPSPPHKVPPTADVTPLGGGPELPRQEQHGTTVVLLAIIRSYTTCKQLTP